MQPHCDGLIRGTAKGAGDRATLNWAQGWEGQGRLPGAPNDSLSTSAQWLSLGTRSLVEEQAIS